MSLSVNANGDSNDADSTGETRNKSNVHCSECSCLLLRTDHGVLVEKKVMFARPPPPVPPCH